MHFRHRQTDRQTPGVNITWHKGAVAPIHAVALYPVELNIKSYSPGGTTVLCVPWTNRWFPGPIQVSKRHLDWFSRFCRAYGQNRHLDSLLLTLQYAASNNNTSSPLHTKPPCRHIHDIKNHPLQFHITVYVKRWTMNGQISSSHV